MGADVIKISIRIVLAELEGHREFCEKVWQALGGEGGFTGPMILERIAGLQRELEFANNLEKAAERKAREYFAKLNELRQTGGAS
ncbi:MAG: hypothetical protein ABSG91_07055 [Syntrophobacteraceae bacterium]|jgi:hypothetical protein